MGCWPSQLTPLEHIVGERLTLQKDISNETTQIHTSDNHVWKVCRGHPKVIRRAFMNNYKVKRLSSCAYVLRPEKLVKFDDHRIGICTPRMTMDLYQLLRSPFDLSRVWDGLTGVAQGIAWMHSNGLAHRDVKPENIVLDHERFCLIDFDFSSSLRTYTHCGTATYTIPRHVAESWKCTDKERSMRHDVYAFGKTVLFVLCCAVTMKMIARGEIVFELYDIEVVPTDTKNPFTGVEAQWFNIAIQCCQSDPPVRIPLADLTTHTRTATYTGADVASPQVVYADYSVA